MKPREKSSCFHGAFSIMREFAARIVHPEKAYSERPAAYTYSETNRLRRFVMPKKIDLTGQSFGRLIVIREAGRKNGHVS